MIQKLTILSGLVLSATCMIYHQPTSPHLSGTQYSNPNYNFAYEVNDPHTGDIKSQQESRQGDSVLGQYSLLQPDGVRRTVDYRADDHSGFQATVNNQGRQYNQNLNGQYSQNLNGQYGQNLNGQYGQNLNGQYGQTLNGQYNQDLNVQYGQNLNGQYGQNLNGQYGQNLNGQYNQDPNGQLNNADASRANSAQAYQQWPASASSAAATPVAVSRTSLVQTFSNSHHPWA